MPSRTARTRLLLTGLGGGGAFTPASLPNLQAWYDASDAATLFQDSAGTTPASADNDVIGRVSDKSGNAHHVLQAVVGNKPLLKTNIQNSRNVIRINDANDLLVSTTGSVSGNANHTILMVVVPRVASGGAFKGFGALGTASSAGSAVSSTVGLSSTDPEFWFGGDDLVAPTGGTAVIGTAVVLAKVHSGGTTTGYINGVATSGSGNTYDLSGGILLGNYINSVAGSLVSDIAEMLVYARALTVSERGQIATYLTVKWNVS